MKKFLCLILCAVIAVSAFASGKKEEQQLEEINISYVRSPFNLPLIIMKEKGMAEKAFGEKGIKVNYYEITSGAKQTEAIAAGSLDIASVINSVSVILANAAGNPVEIFSGFSKPEQMFTILVTCEGYVSPLLISACSKDFAANHPAMLKIYTDTYKEAVKWMNANMEEALVLGAKVQDISMEDARKLFAWSNFTDHLTDADLDALEYDVNFMVDTGMIEKHIDKKDFVNRRALK